VAKGQFTVITLDNQKLELQSKPEQDFYIKAQNKYKSDNVFTVASDERALDRLVLQETLMFRWQQQLASGLDYDGNPLNYAEQEALRKNVKEGAITISNSHNELGLSKLQREKDKAESVQAYLDNLLKRGKEFGIHREKQVDLAINLMNELSAHVGAFSRSNEYERQRIGFKTEADIVKWITEDMLPRFKDIDDKWRASDQKYWRDSI
jgi:hypothetical protein